MQLIEVSRFRKPDAFEDEYTGLYRCHNCGQTQTVRQVVWPMEPDPFQPVLPHFCSGMSFPK